MGWLRSDGSNGRSSHSPPRRPLWTAVEAGRVAVSVGDDRRAVAVVEGAGEVVEARGVSVGRKDVWCARTVEAVGLFRLPYLLTPGSFSSGRNSGRIVPVHVIHRTKLTVLLPTVASLALRTSPTTPYDPGTLPL